MLEADPIMGSTKILAFVSSSRGTLFKFQVFSIFGTVVGIRRVASEGGHDDSAQRL